MAEDVGAEIRSEIGTRTERSGKIEGVTEGVTWLELNRLVGGNPVVKGGLLEGMLDIESADNPIIPSEWQ